MRQRIAELREEERRRLRARPELALRHEMTMFVHGCALLAFGDEGGSGLVASFRKVLALLGDPAQHRTGSRFERTSLDCVDRLRACDQLAEAAADPQRHAARDEAAAEPFTRIPQRVFVGRATPDAHFPLACHNAAGSLRDEVITPYRACLLITSAGHFEPAEERDLLTTMRTLRTRYEDHPSNRPTTATTITRELRTWSDGG